MGAKDTTAQKKAVGPELLAALPQDGKAWYTKSHLLKLNFCIVSLVLYSSANGFDGSLMNGLQALDQWQSYMVKPTGAWLGFINAVYWLGAGIAYPVAAWAANTWGRKPGVYFGYLWLIVGIAVTFSSNRYTFVVSRLLIGIASAWFGSSVPLLINEIAYPTHRGIVSALFMCGWYVGGTVAGFVTFGTRDFAGNWAWRTPYVLQLLLPLVALPGLIFSPESPRWLVSVGRTDEAQQILSIAHGAGDAQDALVAYEMAEITTTIKAEKEADQNSSYLDMIKTPGNRRRLFISVSLGIFSQWSGNGVVSYYLALVLQTVGITSVTHQTLLAGFLQVWNLLFAVWAAFSVDRLGRRPLFLASATIMCISFIVVTALSASFANTQHAATGVAVIPFLFIFFAGYDIALTPFLSAYPCEIWTFSLRAKGLAVTWISAIVAIFFNTFVNAIALESIGWKYYIVFIVVLVCFGLTAFFYYPETRGHTLEAMAVLFDGEQAIADARDAARRASVASISVSEKGGVNIEAKMIHNESV